MVEVGKKKKEAETKSFAKLIEAQGGQLPVHLPFSKVTERGAHLDVRTWFVRLGVEDAFDHCHPTQ
jgi:hypothetical protein